MTTAVQDASYNRNRDGVFWKDNDSDLVTDGGYAFLDSETGEQDYFGFKRVNNGIEIARNRRDPLCHPKARIDIEGKNGVQ